MTTASRGRGALSRFAHFAGMSKPRAEETATTDDVEKVEDKVDETQDDVEDLQDKVDDLEDRIEDVEEDQDEAEDDKVVDPDEPPADKPEARAAYRKGLAKGRKAERARAGAIMSTKVAAANPVLAMHLAFETSATPKSALQTMQAAHAGIPAPIAAPSATAVRAKLDARMDGKARINVGAGAAERGIPTTSAELADSAVALARNAGIVK